MVKVTSSDILAVLRRFSMAADDNVPRHIEQVKLTNPKPSNTLIAFRFNKRQFYILFDETAEDDTNYVIDQITNDKSDIKGEVIENPNNHITTYALPFKGKEVYLFAVKSEKKRLDILLAERFAELSRSTWQKYIKAGYISVNGEVHTSPKYDTTDADSIAVNLPEASDYTENTLPILYIDDDIIVINKPVGVLTHSKGALNDEFTVADFFRRYSTYNLDSNRPGIVHRLDRDTSGVMVGARHETAAKILQKQFADRKTKKTYLAILSKLPKLSKAMIDLPIGRNPNAPSTFRVDSKGKTAVTTYEIIAENNDTPLVKLVPQTGRTHQLRVHMAHLGTPILGDRVYGKKADRLYLHAYSLEITTPNSQRMTFVAPVTPEFIKLYPEVENLI